MSVSIVAVAAVATGLVIARQKAEKPTADDDVRQRAGQERPVEISLEAIRAAGL